MCTYNGCALHDSEVLRGITRVHLWRKYVHECVLTMDVPFMMARYAESLLQYTFQENVCMNVYLQWMCPLWWRGKQSHYYSIPFKKMCAWMCTYNGCALYDAEVLRVISTVYLSRKCVHECLLTMDVPFMMARYSESLLQYTFQENVCMNVYLQWMCPSW